MEILYSSRFEKDFRTLPKIIQKQAIERERWFRADVYDARLKTHSLKGPLRGLHSFSIYTQYRILFEFSPNKKEVYFLRVGTHDVYNYR
jgi:mRNA-degrading endonuclease YafQ of YafQ-DinJ toxin-antitoxin module